jgi:uncharacterized protein (DUF3084 family)
MEEAFNSLNNDERTYEEFIADKTSKLVQAQRDIEQLREKLERAAKQLATVSRDLRRAKNTDEPTAEEKDFKLRELADFNKSKAKELVEISNQYPNMQQTLSLLFTQVRPFQNLNFFS